MFALTVALTVLVGAAAGFMMFRTTSPRAAYPLSAGYDVKSLSRIPVSNFTVSVAEIRRMDHEAFRIVSRAPHTEAETFALYARLAQQERRFIALSYALSGEARGSIVPIAHRVICEALPDDCVFLWRTLDDYRAFDDEYTMALTEAVMKESSVATGGIPDEQAFSSQVFSETDGKDAYETMIRSRTPEEVRAATLWSAGEGTRQAPGILLDLIDGYLALDANRSIGDYAVARSNLMIHAYEAYQGTREIAAHSAYPVLPGREIALPAMVAALRAMSLHLRPLLHERAQKDLDTEVVDATNAFLWSGNYYPQAVHEAERIGEAFAHKADVAFDVP